MASRALLLSLLILILPAASGCAICGKIIEFFLADDMSQEEVDAQYNAKVYNERVAERERRPSGLDP